MTIAPPTRRWVAEVGRLCATESDERVLRVGLVTLLREFVAFESYVWLLTDPTTGVGWAPLADVPPSAALPTLIRLRYRSTQHGWERPAGAEPDHDLPDQWRDHLRSYGVADVLTVAHRDAHGCWGFLDLWRNDRPFEPGETALVEAATSVVTEALRTRQAMTFRTLTEGRSTTGPAVLVLDDELTIVSRTEAADLLLSRLLPADDGQHVVPAAAYNVAARLLAVEAGTSEGTAAARAYVPGAGWLQLRASRLTSSGDEGRVAVAVETASADERLELFARVHALTPREQDVLTHLARGQDNHGLATVLGVSEHTVGDHLKSLHAKTGVRSRGELLSLALGRPGVG